MQTCASSAQNSTPAVANVKGFREYLMATQPASPHIRKPAQQQLGHPAEKEKPRAWQPGLFSCLYAQITPLARKAFATACLGA
jgi:hypothetical protein